MKKILAILLLCSMIFICSGCIVEDYEDAREPEEKVWADGYFIVIKEWGYSSIVYAKDTKVMYYIYSSSSSSSSKACMTPLYNADGTIQVYQGD